MKAHSFLYFFMRTGLTWLIAGMILLPSPVFAGLQNRPLDIASYSPRDMGWTGGFLLNGINSSGRTIAIDGSKVYMGGDFTVAGGVLASNIAVWDGATWKSLGSGLNSLVSALAVDGRGHLYAGGWFTQAGGKPANHIARWDGQTWQAMGDGVDGNVWAIAVDGIGDVYAGGEFRFASGIEANCIAKWDGISWSALGNGVSNNLPLRGWVYALTVDRYGFVYAGGFFTQAGSSPANNIARWDGTTWTALGDGITGDLHSTTVYALATDNRGNLYAGGQFKYAGGKSALNIARWNGESWAEVSGGIVSNEIFKTAVTSIIPDGENLYVGGDIAMAGGMPISGVAKWDGVTWENLKGGVWKDNNYQYIAAMGMDRDGKIFVTGYFDLAGGISANNVAQWDGVVWKGLGADTSVNDFITTMISDRHGGYYAAGTFICAGGQIVNHIAHWDGSNWSGLAGGITNGSTEVPIEALVIDRDGNLIVGGSFTLAGNVPVINIAKWTGSAWESVGGGLNNEVLSLAVDSQNKLYAGGYFLISDSLSLQYSAVAQWNGIQWNFIGSGFDSQVQGMAVDAQDRLVVVGNFNTIGGVNYYGMARWNGEVWESIIDRYLGSPQLLLIDGDTIYVGGGELWKIQNGSATQVGSGFSSLPYSKSWVSALALDPNGRLVVGGEFTWAGTVSANNIARWDGSRWTAFGSGFADGSISSIIFDTAGEMIVAGGFSQAGGKVSQNLAIWHEPFYLWLPMVNRQ